MAASPLTVSLYRALLRSARELERRGGLLRARLAVDRSPSQWLVPTRHSQFQHVRARDHQKTVAKLFPGLREPPAEDALSPARLREIISAEFRAPCSAAALSERLDNGIAAMRQLDAQLLLAQSSSVRLSSLEHDVRVETEAHAMYRGRGPDHWTFQASPPHYSLLAAPPRFPACFASLSSLPPLLPP